MIFVTTGTCEPFDRLLAAIASVELDEELVLQTGASSLSPVGAHCVSFLAYDELLEYVRKARVVVTHAGVGTILTVLSLGKRPVVVPRLKRYGDAVDDHQLELAERLASAGMVELVTELASLEAVLRNGGTTEAPRLRQGGRLASDLRSYIAANAA